MKEKIDLNLASSQAEKSTPVDLRTFQYEEKYEKPSEVAAGQIEKILAGEIVSIDVGDALDIPGEYSPTLWIQFSFDRKEIISAFSCSYETATCISQEALASMLQINRLTRYLELPCALSAKFVEETSDCSFVVTFSQQVNCSTEETRQVVSDTVKKSITLLLILMAGMGVA